MLFSTKIRGENMDTNIEEKIEWFFWELEKLMEKHGFNDVDGDLKILLGENCEYRDVVDIVIYYDDDILSDELYQKIIELYKKFFQGNEQ